MEVRDAQDLRGAFAEVAVLLVDPRINLDEVYAREVHLASLLVDSPVDVDGGVFAVAEGIVSVAIAELTLHVIGAFATLVVAILREARPTEGELIALDPLGEVRLCVKLVLSLVARVTLVVLPADVGAPHFVGRRFVGWTVVGHLEVSIAVEVCLWGVTLEEGVPRLLGGIDVRAPCDFVPLVFIGAAVVIGIVGDHNNPRFTAPSFEGFLVATAIEGIAEDTEVALAGYVRDGMVKADHNISAPATESDQTTFIILKLIQGLSVHILLRVACFIFGEDVRELSHGWEVLEDARDVGAMRVGKRLRAWILILARSEGERQEESERREGTLDIMRCHCRILSDEGVEVAG